jgi:hypothetical protein
VKLWKDHINPDDNPVNMRLDNKMMEFRRPTTTLELPEDTEMNTPVQKLLSNGKCILKRVKEEDEPVVLTIPDDNEERDSLKVHM